MLFIRSSADGHLVSAFQQLVGGAVWNIHVQILFENFSSFGCMCELELLGHMRILCLILRNLWVTLQWSQKSFALRVSA